MAFGNIPEPDPMQRDPVIARATVDHERLRAETLRLRERLRIALETIDETEADAQQSDKRDGEARAA